MDDGLPESLCNPCIETLKSSYEFKKKCERSDSELRKVFLFHLIIKQEPVEVKPEYYNDNDDFRDSDDEPLGKIELKVKKKRKKIPKKTIHSCSECQKIFPKYSKLLRHMKSHEKDMTIKDHICTICQRIFDRASKLERHVKIHNPVLKPYGCKYCENRFKSENLLLTHLITHQGAINGDTTVNENVELKEENVAVIKSEIKVETHPCEQCDKIFYTSHSLSAHMRKHRVKNRILACSICGKVS